MQKTDVILVAQIIKTMHELVVKLEQAYRARDMEKFEILKREVLAMQRKIDALL